MRFGIGDMAGNEILNAMCSDIPSMNAYGSTISHLRRQKEHLRDSKVDELKNVVLKGNSCFLQDSSEL